jgi:DNA-nicking Smr family endonuclease
MGGIIQEIMAMGKKDDLFNPAFQDLQSIIKDSQDYQKAHEESDAQQPDQRESSPDHEHSFQEAMSDVVPLPGKRRKAIRNPAPDMRPAHPAPDDEQETMAYLRNLVKGSLEMDITFSDEYIEGSVSGLSPKLMKRLKKGQFPVQAHIDLHGLTKHEAQRKVRDFLIQSRKLGLRCVLIVHGRGLNSPDSMPVLKERLPIWLNRGLARKIVLAFATAMPYDGGTGAIYVLLRMR